VAGAGVELVQIERQGEILRVYIDRPEGVTLDDCERVSHGLSAAVDEVGEYTLEVSSPGLDRPLVKPADFQRFAGQRARLRSREPIHGSKNFVGVLGGGDEAGVRIQVEGGPEVVVEWDNLEAARLAPQWRPAGPPARGRKKSPAASQ